MPETIAIASDHAGVELKATLKAQLETLGFVPLDLGTDSTASVDYPDYAHALADVIKAGKVTRGILICGSGIGISIAANRHPHIRAALCYTPTSAQLARQHNDANVLVLGARAVTPEIAKECLSLFLSTPFEGGRHQLRVEKLNTMC